MTRAGIAAAASGTAASAACLAAAYAAAGARGLVVGATVLAAVTLLAGRALIPPAAARAVRSRTASSVVSAADFPAYRRIESDLGWAGASRRHYDHSTRPMLNRLLSAMLEERRRVDIARQPAQARRLVGEELWALIDLSAPPSQDSAAPGVDLTTLSAVVSRLEDL